MTTVFTDRFRALLYASLDKTAPIDPSQNLMVGKTVHWVFFRSYAAFTDENDARYTAVQTIADLAAVPGWSAPITPSSTTQAVGATTPATTVTYCIANNAFSMGGGWASSTVVAAALVLEGTHTGTVDPVIYITDDPFEGGVVLDPADTLIARPVTAVAGNRPLFSWDVYTAGQTTARTVEGSVAVLEAPPTYELAYTRHCWLYPQRTNFIANPSFELGTNHWRTNGALTRVQGTEAVPAAPGGGAWFGRFAGTNVVVESNQFPLNTHTSVEDLWTIQAMVRGTGKLRVALLGWEPEVTETRSDWGDSEVWDLPPNGFLHLYALRRSGETTTGMVRFECTGNIEIDNVLVEPDWLKDWAYFDGDSTYGARDDYAWYGGEARKGQTYSTWYNHKRAVTGRLFAWDISSEDFTITDEEVEAQGFVYKWVPAGVRVTPHIDVLVPNDIQEVVPAVSGTVTRYKTGVNDALGVVNPWAADQYLVPTVGIVSTPDAPDLTLDGDIRVTSYFRDDSAEAAASRIIATKTGGVDYAFSLLATFTSNWYVGIGYPAGTATPNPGFIPGTRAAFGLTPPGADLYRGAIFSGVVPGNQTATCRAQAIVSTNGSTWTNQGGLTVAQRADALTRDSALPLQIGLGWQGRIHWAQMEAVNRAQLQFPGVNGSYLTVPDSAALAITGDLEVVVRFSPSTSAYGTLVCRDGTPRGWRLGVTATQLSFSPLLPGGGGVSNTLPAGSMLWGKMTRVASTGAVAFFTAPDGPTEPTTWNAWGTYAGTAGALSNPTTGVAVSMGARSAGTSEPYGGRLARLIVRNGIAGTTVLDVSENNAGMMATANTFVATSGQTVTVNQTGATVVQPQADSLIWRFDATEYPGQGTTYTDPRGRVWTLTSAAAIART